MRRNLALGRLFIAAVPLLIPHAPAHAQANRVFVAAQSGKDSSFDCSNVVTPCQSFAVALTKVAPGGEIIALESGGYGPMAINQAVRISAPAGIVAFTHPPSGDAVAINAPGATVVLRGLTLNSGTGYGIKVTNAGKLFVERCTVTGFTQDGIFFQVPAGKLFLHEVDVLDSGNGVNVAAGSAVIRDGTFSDNANAGVLASNGSSVAVIHATAAGNAIGFSADNNASMMLDGVQAVSNTDKGFSATGVATLRFVNSVASQNNTGVASAGGGTLMGSNPGTSVVAGNPSSDGIPNGTAMTLR